jgi:hypothetical protein
MGNVIPGLYRRLDSWWKNYEELYEEDDDASLDVEDDSITIADTQTSEVINSMVYFRGQLERLEAYDRFILGTIRNLSETFLTEFRREGSVDIACRILWDLDVAFAAERVNQDTKRCVLGCYTEVYNRLHSEIDLEDSEST